MDPHLNTNDFLYSLTLFTLYFCHNLIFSRENVLAVKVTSYVLSTKFDLSQSTIPYKKQNKEKSGFNLISWVS